jgi:type I restriction enzyme M protein
VQAHLIGGIPEEEVFALQNDFARFGVQRDLLFHPERPGYLAFRECIDGKPAIKTTLEADSALQQTLTRHHNVLEAWWTVARDDFAKLREGKKLPEVRHELLTTIKDKLIPLHVLDEFKSAGVFVNWWQQIRYDLKTIVSTGWHQSLIPDEYLVLSSFRRKPTKSNRWMRRSARRRANWPKPLRPRPKWPPTNRRRTRRSPPLSSKRRSRN